MCGDPASDLRRGQALGNSHSGPVLARTTPCPRPSAGHPPCGPLTLLFSVSPALRSKASHPGGWSPAHQHRPGEAALMLPVLLSSQLLVSSGSPSLGQPWVPCALPAGAAPCTLLLLRFLPGWLRFLPLMVCPISAFLGLAFTGAQSLSAGSKQVPSNLEPGASARLSP